MSEKLEKHFENKIKRFLNTLPNTWHFKHWAGPYSPSGIPDIIACVNGRFVGIEVKKDSGKVSKLQERNIRLINNVNGVGVILYPNDFENFKKMIMKLVKDEV